jgi:hypothetical protein
MEINKLRKPDGLRYRVTANELPGGEFAANVQIRSDEVVIGALGTETPSLKSSVANALIEIAVKILHGDEEKEDGQEDGGGEQVADV